jgi:hypothetical protein
VEKQTQDILLSAQDDITNAPFSLASSKNDFGHPDDSNLYGPFHGIWFTYHSDSWNPFLRGTRGENFGGELSNDADKWIGYEEVLSDPTKVAIWYNPLPPQPLPDPPYIARVFNKDDPSVKAFLLAEKYMELAFELVMAYMPDILDSVLDTSDIISLIENIGEIGLEALKGVATIISTAEQTRQLEEACKTFIKARAELEQAGSELFTSDVPYEPYKPYGDEILKQGPSPSPTPTPEPAPTPEPGSTPTPDAP